MLVGIPKEIKDDESRVSLVPAGAEALAARGHEVLVEAGAGAESGFSDADYRAAGGEVAGSAEEVFQRADLIIKVKEPLPVEYPLLRPGQIVFTYFHFAASRELTEAVLRSQAVAIAYETIEREDGALPLLTPMSEVAGCMAVQQGAKYLEREHGGRGVLMSGVPGVEPATVLVIGGGVVGKNAARMAAGLGARVFILDIRLERLRHLSDVMPPNVVPMMSHAHNLRELLPKADVVISGVLIPGSRAPKLVTREMLKLMKPGAVIVDVAIDQGGSLETSRPTTHEEPIYEVDGVIHYCVTNMPGAMPVTSTIALTNATLPYALELADKGYRRAIRENPAIRSGANLVLGKITYQRLAEVFGMDYVPVEEALG